MARYARVVGNAMEYMVCRALQIRNCKPKDAVTNKRMVKLKRDYDIVSQRCDQSTKINLQLIQVYDRLGIVNGHFRVNEDQRGAYGDTADVVVENIGGECMYKFSVKHNNASVKHQRSNKLYMQLDMSDTDVESFRSDYKLINDTYYTKWSSMGYKRFEQCPIEEKFELYREINALTKSFLLKNKEYMHKYISFIADYDPAKRILKWDSRHHKLHVIDTACPDLENSTIDVSINDSFLCITVNSRVYVRARLHNASGRITPTLSLKYDTALKE